MGRGVQLWKAEDSTHAVVYRYGPSKDLSGRLSVSKQQGTVTLLEAVPGIPEEEEKFLYRDLAILKLQMLFERGTFPEQTFVGT